MLPVYAPVLSSVKKASDRLTGVVLSVISDTSPVAMPLGTVTAPPSVMSVPWAKLVLDGVIVTEDEANFTLFQLVTSWLASTVPRPVARSYPAVALYQGVVPEPICPMVVSSMTTGFATAMQSGVASLRSHGIELVPAVTSLNDLGNCAASG